MARSVKVPAHVLDSKISHSALALWIQLARRSSPKNPLMMLNLQSLADDLGRSKRTVSRLIGELEKAGLLMRTDIIDRRHKIGRLMWTSKTPAKKPPEPKPSSPSPQGGEGFRVSSLLDRVPPELQAETMRLFRESLDEWDFNFKVEKLLSEHKFVAQRI